jgi:hypothetical protein
MFASGKDPARARQPGIDFPVTSISDDGRGSLWLGGRAAGITRFRVSDGRVTRYTKRDGLFDDSPSRALADGDGNMWFKTSDAIYMASRSDLDNFAERRVSRVRARVFVSADGMNTSEPALAQSQPGGWRDASGRLWFTSAKGLLSIDPGHLTRNNLVPPVLVESVVVNNRTLPAGNDFQIDPGRHQIEFHFTALSLLIPERVQFRYKLEDFDSGWVDAGSRRVAYYNNLPPGKYRFRVIASNDDGLWNETGATVKLTLMPHFYQTIWFEGTCVFLVLVLIYSAFRINTRRIRARATELSRIVDERATRSVLR